MKLLIITNVQSEFSRLLSDSFNSCDIMTTSEAAGADIKLYDRYAILANGHNWEDENLWQDLGERIDAEIESGKKVFSSGILKIGDTLLGESVSTRFERPILTGRDNCGITDGIDYGTIFDEQSNIRRKVRRCSVGARPILIYESNPEGFYVCPKADEIQNLPENYALWLDSDSFLCCSFNICNFASAMFAPRRSWSKLFCGIIGWLGGKCVEAKVGELFAEVYNLRGKNAGTFETAEMACKWFENADMLMRRGQSPYAVKEGLSAYVFSDGSHGVLSEPRVDQAGETALMYYFRYLATGDKSSLENFRSMIEYPLTMQVKSGPHAGMVRWTQSSYFAEYQDDAARGFMLPILWYTLFSGDRSYLEKARAALDYLLKTTGTDGLRALRTDVADFNSDKISAAGLIRDKESGKWGWGGQVSGEHTIKELSEMPGGTPSAHYNAFYLASLILFGLITGEKSYSDAGEKGLSSIMRDYYPETAREHSETQELCRLILPLSMLYISSEDAEKRSWLYRVADDLERFRHKNGGYAEWDTGYIATCAGVKSGESSVLAENGNPVADMLYSLNWLSVGFVAAYAATGDERFRKSADFIFEYYAKTQIISRDKNIAGAWPRSIDLDCFEVYGVPNDVGWAPWSVEAGWTVAEITAGLYLSSFADKLRERLISL